jgi:hypothetical protein
LGRGDFGGRRRIVVGNDLGIENEQEKAGPCGEPGVTIHSSLFHIVS